MGVLEMSAAAGLTLIPEENRNPLTATTYGVGEMIKDAIGKGCRRFLVGIGGSGSTTEEQECFRLWAMNCLIKTEPRFHLEQRAGNALQD